MIQKNIFKYLSINKLTYFFILIAILAGHFHLLFFVSFLLIIHELGHFLTALILGLKVDKIYIYPFGGVAKFHLPLNYSIKKELLILIMGPVFQEIAKTFLIRYFYSYENIIISYHYSILIFNLLPIYPLDGGKLINLLISIIKPYKKAFVISIFISYLTIFFLILINLDNIKINIIVLVFFLIYKVLSEKKKINFIYENFLLERYINKYHFKSSKIINNLDDFYKNKRHLIKIGDKYALEADFLSKKYTKRSWHFKKCCAIIYLSLEKEAIIMGH